jgi:hypothetical protein
LCGPNNKIVPATTAAALAFRHQYRFSRRNIPIAGGTGAQVEGTALVLDLKEYNFHPGNIHMDESVLRLEGD